MKSECIAIPVFVFPFSLCSTSPLNGTEADQHFHSFFSVFAFDTIPSFAYHRISTCSFCMLDWLLVHQFCCYLCGVLFDMQLELLCVAPVCFHASLDWKGGKCIFQKTQVLWFCVHDTSKMITARDSRFRLRTTLAKFVFIKHSQIWNSLCFQKMFKIFKKWKKHIFKNAHFVKIFTSFFNIPFQCLFQKTKWKKKQKNSGIF